MATKPLIVIIGETASGKSALALQLARKFNGEIVAADSRTVYRGMDIGTAKPSEVEQREVSHHMLNLVEPDKSYDVKTYQGQTIAKIQEITGRGKLPILVGGTGLYVDSVIFEYGFNPEATVRDELNPRHAKKSETSQVHKDMRPNTLLLGINIDKDGLEKRIVARVNQMVEQGLEAEVRHLSEKYGWGNAMSAVGYQEWEGYFAGSQTLDKTIELITIHTRQYAKRQRAWFKRNSHIHWFGDAASALAFASNWLIAASSSGSKSTTTAEL